MSNVRPHHYMVTSLQDEIATLGQARLIAIKSLGPTAIRQLPKVESEDLTVCGKKVAVTVYRDELPDDRLLVVVQIYRNIFFSYGRMFVVGFVVERDGSFSEPEPKMLWDYT